MWAKKTRSRGRRRAIVNRVPKGWGGRTSGAPDPVKSGITNTGLAGASGYARRVKSIEKSNFKTKITFNDKIYTRCKVDARAHQHHAASRSSLRELAIHLPAQAEAKGAQASRKMPSAAMQR